MCILYFGRKVQQQAYSLRGRGAMRSNSHRISPHASMSAAESSHHRRTLLFASIAVRLLVACLVYLTSFLPLFDKSPVTVLPPHTSRLTGALLRWDSFHFGAVALNGYVHEHQWAFFSGLPLTMRHGGALLRYLGLSSGDWPPVLNAGALGAAVCGLLSTQTLYELSLRHFGSPNIAFLAASLSLLPSSPAALLFAPYTEPYFALFTYQGMLECCRKRYLRAALWFALSAAFRSNGMLNAGFIVWDLCAQDVVIQRKIPSFKRILAASALTILVCAPVLAHQIFAYRIYCLDDTSSYYPIWCTYRVPSIYTYVQTKYWNVGFLRYWTPAQTPNIALAVPVLAVVLSLCAHHLRHSLVPTLLGPKPKTHPNPSPFLHPSLAPHVIHAVLFSMVLLFASNTQIALRAASAMPTTYWAGAWLLMEKPWAGRVWIRWSVVWGALSIILWTTFLPPA